jgi:LAGLIDADG endonuclease
VTKRKLVELKIGQGAANVKVLHHIKKTLGFGVMTYNKTENVYQLTITRLDHVRAIIFLFNGNMVLPSREARFQTFLIAFNARADTVSVPYIGLTLLPTLQDTWLLGFSEAEGCFHARLNGRSFVTLYSVSQNGTVNRKTHPLGAGRPESHLKDAECNGACWVSQKPKLRASS